MKPVEFLNLLVGLLVKDYVKHMLNNLIVPQMDKDFHIVHLTAKSGVVLQANIAVMRLVK